MKWPRNGSWLANCLLVGVGAAFGATLMWLGTGLIGGRNESGGSRELELREHGLSAREYALNPSRADDSHLGAREQIQHALQEVDPGERSEALRQAGAAAANHDLSAALREGLEIDSERDKLDYHLGLFGEWAQSDPEAALDHAKATLPAGMLQSEAIGIAINKWGDQNPHDAWIWAEQNLTGPLKERAMTDLVIGWTRRTPSAAADWLTGTGLTSQPLYNAVARTWAEQNPKQAAAWARGLPDGIARQTAEVAVAGEWASQDPAAAARSFSDEIAEENGANLAIALADVWATTDPAATAQWIAQLPPGNNRNLAAGALASIWGTSDIDAAVDWSRSIKDDSMRRQAVTHLGTTWGAIEPGRALDWLTSLPAADAAEGIRGAFYSWAGTDPVGLHEWIDQAPGDPLSDQGRRSLGEVLTATDMPAAMDLALGMSSSTERDQAAGRFFREWRRLDEAASRDWLQDRWDTLPAETQQRLEQEQALPIVPR